MPLRRGCGQADVDNCRLDGNSRASFVVSASFAFCRKLPAGVGAFLGLFGAASSDGCSVF